MAKICYIPKVFNAQTSDLIKKCERIVRSYQAQGYRLTLRQIYYRLVALDQFPDDRKWKQVPGTNKWVRDPQGTKNAEPNYKWLGGIINDARLAGLIDWSAIEDRTRNLEQNPHWENPADIVEAIAVQYRNNLWANQPYRPEVWVEKDALEGVVESACKPLDVPFFSCRGYTSQTAIWEAAMRLKRYTQTAYFSTGIGGKFKKYQTPIIFHLGDHDPSGIDMTRDIEERIHLFVGKRVEIRRIALNMDQVEQYGPPPNPAKQTDSRFQGYMDVHGDESWELDALEPTVLVALIRKHIKSVRDDDIWSEDLLTQETGRAQLTAISKNYKEVEETVEQYVELPTLEDDEDPEDEDDQDPDEEER